MDIFMDKAGGSQVIAIAIPLLSEPSEPQEPQQPQQDGGQASGIPGHVPPHPQEDLSGHGPAPVTPILERPSDDLREAFGNDPQAV
eukprot:8193187-Heterocapsa_arctica.AAC.1